MQRVSLLTGALMLIAAAASAQTPEPSAQRRFQPPPDHWMTIVSLCLGVGPRAAPPTNNTPATTAFTGFIKPAAARRQAIRQQFQASGFTPGQEPTPEMRARMDSIRTEMEGFQAEADQWYAAIRNNLTPAQQTKFDALAKPMVFRPRGAPGSPPGPPPQ